MSDSPVRATKPAPFADLRSRAALRLSGSGATKGPAMRAADALTVLLGLASRPDTAADALTLLHELQVHQVELDMQTQELQESRSELEQALRRQLVIYDSQPVGSFTTDARLVLLELNQTGADMLGLARDDAYGLPLDLFLCAESARQFRAAIAGFDAGTAQPACLLKLCPKAGPERPVLASIGADPATKGYLVGLMSTGPAQEPPPVTS